MKKLVFDFDGTLVDCSVRDYNLYVDIMDDLGCQALDFNEYWPLRRERSNIRELVARTAVAPDLIDKFLELRHDRHESLMYLELDRPFNDTIPTLQALQNLYELHLVSARANHENLEWELNELGLRKYLTNVVAAATSDKLGAIESLGSDIVAVVGDTEHDILPALSLGIKAIGVTTGIRSREFLINVGADRVIDTLGDVLVQ